MRRGVMDWNRMGRETGWDRDDTPQNPWPVKAANGVSGHRLAFHPTSSPTLKMAMPWRCGWRIILNV
jgi:hypothetical protein